MLYLSVLLLLFSFVLGNVEKAIFLAPPAINIPQDHPNLDNLYLTPLSPPAHQSVRTHLNSSFPTPDSPRGSASWFLLDGLNPNQRYEVRVCWLATQPTSFWLTTHTLETVFESPELISSLTSYAFARAATLSSEMVEVLQSRRVSIPHATSGKKPSDIKASILLLEIQAAADYFSLDKTLMENVPPVFADIILDPFILNIFPQSLVPTAGYIICIAIIAWFVSGHIWKLLNGYTETMSNEKKASQLAEKKRS